MSDPKMHRSLANRSHHAPLTFLIIALILGVCVSCSRTAPWIDDVVREIGTAAAPKGLPDDAIRRAQDITRSRLQGVDSKKKAEDGIDLACKAIQYAYPQTYIKKSEQSADVKEIAGKLVLDVDKEAATALCAMKDL